HPVQTFPDAASAVERLAGAWIAVTAESPDGYDRAESLARDVGGRPFRVAGDRKPLYHAAAVFASNYVVAVLGIAEELFRAAGVTNPMEVAGPLVRASVDNVVRLGPAEALTGPAARGDAGTVDLNLTALAQTD